MWSLLLRKYEQQTDKIEGSNTEQSVLAAIVQKWPRGTNG